MFRYATPTATAFFHYMDLATWTNWHCYAWGKL